MNPITSITRLPANGQTAIQITPPKPCGLDNCVGELLVTMGHDSMRLHLGPEQREGLIKALGGTVLDRATARRRAFPALADDALPDLHERAEQRGLGR